MIEADLHAFLLEQTAIAALIGTRIYPTTKPQGAALPALTYQRISGGEDNTHSGAGPARALMQIGCWAERYDASLALEDVVRAALASHRGPMGTARYVTGQVVNATDLPDPTVKLNCRALDVAISYEA